MSVNTETPQFLTIKQFVEKQTAFTSGGVRSLIFYRGDDAEKVGAIARLGRRILIDEIVFLAWIKEGGARQIRGQAA